MTIHDGYMLTELCGETYLLPYGQNIATFYRGIRLNETGRLIWNALLDGTSAEDLLPLLAAHFGAQEAELPMLRADIAQFLEQLRLHGMIDRPALCCTIPSDVSRKFMIGTILLQLNLPDTYIPEAFFPFSAETEDAAKLVISVRASRPAQRPAGKLLVRSDDLIIIEHADGYCLLFLSSPDLIECQIDRQLRTACFYCRGMDSDTFREELFHGIRFVYLMQAQTQGLFAIHSASILYREQAWLFSAPSGTGKTTHANLWKSLYDVTLLNGDLNLLGMRDAVPVVYGLPWCGTSGIYTTQTTPLGGIVFLQQASTDRIEALTADRQQLLISQRMISPTWTEDMLRTCLSFAGQIAAQRTCFLLHCTKQQSAAAVCRAAIDQTSVSSRKT